MNFNKAQYMIEHGEAIVSKVSNTIYEMEENGVLLAEGSVVNEKFLTDKEMNGKWEEVRFARTELEYRKL